MPTNLFLFLSCDKLIIDVVTCLLENKYENIEAKYKRFA